MEGKALWEGEGRYSEKARGSLFGIRPIGRSIMNTIRGALRLFIEPAGEEGALLPRRKLPRRVKPERKERKEKKETADGLLVLTLGKGQCKDTYRFLAGFLEGKGSERLGKSDLEAIRDSLSKVVDENVYNEFTRHMDRLISYARGDRADSEYFRDFDTFVYRGGEKEKAPAPTTIDHREAQATLESADMEKKAPSFKRLGLPPELIQDDIILRMYREGIKVPESRAVDTYDQSKRDLLKNLPQKYYVQRKLFSDYDVEEADLSEAQEKASEKYLEIREDLEKKGEAKSEGAQSAEAPAPHQAPLGALQGPGGGSRPPLLLEGAGRGKVPYSETENDNKLNLFPGTLGREGGEPPSLHGGPFTGSVALGVPALQAQHAPHLLPLAPQPAAPPPLGHAQPPSEQPSSLVSPLSGGPFGVLAGAPVPSLQPGPAPTLSAGAPVGLFGGIGLGAPGSLFSGRLGPAPPAGQAPLHPFASPQGQGAPVFSNPFAKKETTRKRSFGFRK